MNKKIVVCGGHHNSALVVAEKLREKGYEVFWFGHKYSMIRDKNPSAEYLEVTGKGFAFVEIKAGKFQPKERFFSYLLRIPLGFWQSVVGLWRIKPNLIVSFGGYLALPVVVGGWLLCIPSVSHEQTTVSGWANKTIALFCQKIFISFSTSLQYFPKEKTILTGLPIRKEIFEKGKKLFKNSRKTIYVTGGKQGAHVINEAVFAVLPQLLSNFNVIHQCGSTSLYHNFEKALQIKEKLKKNKENYLVKEYFFNEEIGPVFNSADFVISRAGAHTVYELLLLEKPAILIPIPWSSHHEQEENAKLLVAADLAEILPQEELEKGKLLEKVWQFAEKLANYRLSSSQAKPSTNADGLIVSEIEKFLN